ncbi:MAG: CAP domain-containing protein, partial [Ardenticatenia bacterium]|nr:CAP domain-containing protein [Ardenticatenia bacterium]
MRAHHLAVLFVGSVMLSLWAVVSACAQQASVHVDSPLVVHASATPMFSEEALTVTASTNQYRQEAGCPPLTLSAQLTEAAQRHTDDMAYNDFSSHTGSDGSSPWDRIRDTGYEFILAGENIAAGYPTAQAVV